MMKKSMVFVALIVMLFVNMLAVLLPINKVTTKELSDAIPIFFVPAGYVFSIWSVIYLALIGYAIYQLLPVAKHDKKLHSIAGLFVVNALANAGWILLWHYRYVTTSVLVMLLILATLILIYQKLGIGQTQVSRQQYWLSHFPFSLYLGWICVATIANIAGALYVHQWSGWGITPELWSTILIIVTTILTLSMLLRRRDYVFAAVIIWAVIGIGVKFAAVPIILWTVIPSILVITVMMVLCQQKIIVQKYRESCSD